jgi:hypothetical protein
MNRGIQYSGNTEEKEIRVATEINCPYPKEEKLRSLCSLSKEFCPKNHPKINISYSTKTGLSINCGFRIDSVCNKPEIIGDLGERLRKLETEEERLGEFQESLPEVISRLIESDLVRERERRGY